MASRETTSLRDALSIRDTSLSRDAALPPLPPTPPREAFSKGELVSNSGPRTLLDDAADLGLAPPKETLSRWEAAPPQASAAGPASETRWKRKKRSSDVFEGDAALKELRSRLAAAPTDQAPEPPLTPTKTPVFASAVRLMGVVGVAAGGALGFLWITSPHGLRLPSLQAGEEVALVSLRETPTRSAAENIAAQRAPASSRSADAPWSVANYTSDAADKAVTPPVVPQPRTAGPPRSPVPVARVAAPPPVQPAPAAAVTPPPPAPAAVTAPPPAPMPATVTTPLLDRDEINAMLGRARNFLSTGDVAAARVVLRRAAASDDPQAALALGGTYDPSVLKKLGIISFHADPAMARDWYRKAAALGSADASLRLEQLVQTDR
jgi:hypothetical protein